MKIDEINALLKINFQVDLGANSTGAHARFHAG